ncbi:MAG: hypothetical protein R2764_01430 [Bacteroidales bacterium]
MLKSIYDPNTVEADAFDMDNMKEGAYNLILSKQERINNEAAVAHSDSPHAPANAQKNSDITKAEIEAKLTGEISSHSHAAASPGFAINVLSARVYNPDNDSIDYFSNVAYAALNVESYFYLFIRQNCTLKIAEINCFAATIGSAEGWSLYVRKNASIDTLIATVGQATLLRNFSNTEMNINFNAGDYFTIKVVNPTWATTPRDVVFGGYLYFELT